MADMLPKAVLARELVRIFLAKILYRTVQSASDIKRATVSARNILPRYF